MAESGLLCWSCGKPTGIENKVFRSDACTSCLADLRCCRGCRHFDPLRRWQCRETITTRIGDKDKSNLCDYFQMRNVVKRPGGISANQESKGSRKDRFDDLFKD